MEESIVVNIDGKLLVKIIESAETRNLNLSKYISAVLAQDLDAQDLDAQALELEYESHEITCLRAPASGICLKALPKDAKLYAAVDTLERKMIKRALNFSNNVQSHAAELIGIGRSGFNQKMQKHKLVVAKSLTLFGLKSKII